MGSLPSAHRQSVSPTDSASFWRHAIVLSFCLLVSACAGVRVEYFTEDTYQPRRAMDQIEVLEQEPHDPHIELARITVTSANLGEESLRRRLLDKASSLGADAIVNETPATRISNVGSPYYEPGLLGPAGAAFGLYGYGWYTPYASNPYLLTQGATDQPRFDHSLSAIAIRYQPDREPAPAR